MSYRSGLCTVGSVPANPPIGEFVHEPLFGGKNPLGTCTWDWGPTPATANQIMYTENASGDSSIYKITEAGIHPGQKLTQFSDIEYQLLEDLHWLPNGSGLLYSTRTLMRDSANLFRYDFASRKVSQVTKFDNEFVRNFSIAPDGQAIVFERAKSLDDDAETDLWIINIDGSQPRLLVRNGFSPSWH